MDILGGPKKVGSTELSLLELVSGIRFFYQTYL